MYTLETELMQAVRDANLEVVQSLLERGCKIDGGDGDNMTPLHLAATRDQQEIARFLIEKGANVNCKTTEKMVPLHYAACKGYMEMVTLLIEGGAAVDALDANDRTPLMLAVIRDHFDVVEVLITYGAKINIEEIHGYTPLCEAVWNKSVDIARLLLGSGAKLTQSQHLLHYSVLHRHLPMAELLLRYGAYPNLRDDHGDTPLILAITCCHLDMIKLLLEYEAKPNYANSVNGITPLHKALTVGIQDALFSEILSLLCMYDVDLNITGGGAHTTPLATALITGSYNCAASMIRAGADVNKPSDSSHCLWQVKQPSNLDFALNKKVNDLIYLMVAAGLDLSKYDVDFPKDFSKVDVDTLTGWLTYMKFNPRRLTDLCRLVVRAQMGSQVLQIVPALEIPQSLKQFLLFHEIHVKYPEPPGARLAMPRFYRESL